MCFGSSARPPSPVGRPPRLVSSLTRPAQAIHEHRVPWSGAGQYVFTVAFRPAKPDFNDQPTLASVTIQAFNMNDDPIEQTRRGKLLYDAHQYSCRIIADVGATPRRSFSRSYRGYIHNAVSWTVIQPQGDTKVAYFLVKYQITDLSFAIGEGRDMHIEVKVAQ